MQISLPELSSLLTSPGKTQPSLGAVDDTLKGLKKLKKHLEKEKDEEKKKEDAKKKSEKKPFFTKVQTVGLVLALTPIIVPLWVLTILGVFKLSILIATKMLAQ